MLNVYAKNSEISINKKNLLYFLYKYKYFLFLFIFILFFFKLNFRNSSQ